MKGAGSVLLRLVDVMTITDFVAGSYSKPELGPALSLWGSPDTVAVFRLRVCARLHMV